LIRRSAPPGRRGNGLVEQYEVLGDICIVGIMHWAFDGGCPGPIHRGIRADIASGDGGTHTRSLGSFNPLFPAAPVYSGPSGLLGPTNLIDLTPSLRLSLSKVSATLESSSFWRESLQDGIYSPSVAAAPAVRRGDGSQARYVATAPSVTLSYPVTRHVFVTTTYTRFLTGQFLNESLPNRDVNYVASWITYRF
jgi:hypothetical protein